jgi:hypothetical protein
MNGEHVRTGQEVAVAETFMFLYHSLVCAKDA